MVRKPVEKNNKEEHAHDQVRIRILPLRGIGGIGNAGDQAWMSREDADQYVADGYVEILPDANEPVPATPSTDAVTSEDPEPVTDHTIMAAENKRL